MIWAAIRVIFWRVQLRGAVLALERGIRGPLGHQGQELARHSYRAEHARQQLRRAQCDLILPVKGRRP